MLARPALVRLGARKPMNPRVKIGSVGETQVVVEAKHAIDFADDTLPAVLCTPWLVWFLEHAARAAVLPALAANESTVGTEIEVAHLAPTPLGRTVTCRARVIRVEGREVSFTLEADDGVEPIARGFHRLRIIDKQRFAARVARKQSGG